MYLLTDIGRLCGVRSDSTPIRGRSLAHLVCIEDAYLIVEGKQIAAYGKMSELPVGLSSVVRYSLGGRYVLPSFCDSHTHLVFAASREKEFVERLKGKSYTEIAEAGGGILNSAARLEEISEDLLFVESWKRLQKAISSGTGALEIKTGYGLLPEMERKMLRVIARLREKSPIPVQITYLALHALPIEYRNRRSDYLRLVCEEMLPWVAKTQAADYVDVFCEKAFFSTEECKEVLQKAKALGLRRKLHAEQLSASGGIQLALSVEAQSVDHLESLQEEDVLSLAKSNTFATLLPSSAFFLGEGYSPARSLISADAQVALASDYNPGSSPSQNLHFVWSLACIAMKMLPEEALQALTFNGAAAMNLQKTVGSIAKGKRANLLITEPVPSLAYLPYSFAQNWLEGIMVAGNWHQEPNLQ